MRMVVTGASGHVGANLVRTLVAQGVTVRAVCHLSTLGLDGTGIEICRGNVCEPVSLKEIFTGADVVYHLAARISLLGDAWPEMERVNVLGTRHVVQACLQAEVGRLVHFSSIHALDPAPLDAPVDEARPRVSQPDTPAYDRSKALAEVEVENGMARGLNAVILNPTGVLGPYDFHPSHLGAVIMALARGRMPLLVNGGFNWVDVRDVVDAAINAAAAAPFGAKYILSGHWRTLPEMAAAVARVTGGPLPRLVSPYWLARLGAPLVCRLDRIAGRRPLLTPFSLGALRQFRHVSHDFATAAMNYHPRPFEETVADTVHWFQDHGYLESGRRRG